MSCSFHPEARSELERAVEYYEDREPGLGLDFAGEVHDAIQRIVDHPEAWAEVRPGIRRCLVRRFPFGVLYSAQADHIVILALMHLSRRPGYWHDRAE